MLTTEYLSAEPSLTMLSVPSRPLEENTSLLWGSKSCRLGAFSDWNLGYYFPGVSTTIIISIEQTENNPWFDASMARPEGSSHAASGQRSCLALAGRTQCQAQASIRGAAIPELYLGEAKVKNSVMSLKWSLEHDQEFSLCCARG